METTSAVVVKYCSEVQKAIDDNKPFIFAWDFFSIDDYVLGWSAEVCLKFCEALDKQKFSGILVINLPSVSIGTCSEQLLRRVAQYSSVRNFSVTELPKEAVLLLKEFPLLNNLQGNRFVVIDNLLFTGFSFSVTFPCGSRGVSKGVATPG